MPSRARRCTAGASTSIVFVAEQARFAGVRVEPGQRQARLDHAKVRQRVWRSGQSSRSTSSRRHERRHVSQRHVHRDQHDLQLRRMKHHGDPRRRRTGARADRCGPSTAGRPATNASLLIGAVAMASTSPRLCGVDRAEEGVVGRLARRRRDLAHPDGRRRRRRRSIGSQTARTPGSAAALATISGPMPAGSPAVSAMRGRRISSVSHAHAEN